MAPEIRPPLTSRLIGWLLLGLVAAGLGSVGLGAARSMLGPAAVPVGEIAPDFEAPGPDGEPVRLSSLKGQVVFLDVWSHRCIGCVSSTPRNNRLFSELQAHGVAVLGVNQDGGLGEMAAYMRDRPMAYPSVLDDGTIASSFGVSAVPAAVLLDREGVIRARYVGAVSKDRLRRELLALAREGDDRR